MNLVRTFGAGLLAALVLVASTNFYVAIHTCGGDVKAVSLLHETDGCGHSKLPPCHRAMMKDCCDDQQIEHPAQDLKKDVPPVTLPVASSVDIIHTPVVLAELIPSSTNTFSSLTPYRPPVRTINITVLHEVFLI